MKSKVLGHLFSQTWAILPESLEQIISIASREHVFDKEALSAKRDEYLKHTANVQVRGDVAIVPIHGPIISRGNFFSDISGATTTADLMADINQAVENPQIKTIILAIDSPGGEVSGISELASFINSASKKKRIISHAQGLCASAAFWIASATSKIYASDTALIGSIGVIFTCTDDSARQEKNGIKTYEFVSSMSKNKRPDLSSDDGKAQMQKMVDDLGSVFVSSVAKYRGISSEDVLNNYGQGKMFVGSEALKQGMIDHIATFEESLTHSLQNQITTGVNITMNEKLTVDSLKASNPEIFAAIKKEGFIEGVAHENARIKSIEDLNITGSEKIVAEHKFNTEVTAERMSFKILEEQKKASKNLLTNIETDAKNLNSETTGTTTPAGDNSNNGVNVGSVVEEMNKLNAKRGFAFLGNSK